MLKNFSTPPAIHEAIQFVTFVAAASFSEMLMEVTEAIVAELNRASPEPGAPDVAELKV
jgi:hypothetical protein